MGGLVKVEGVQESQCWKGCEHEVRSLLLRAENVHLHFGWSLLALRY